MEVYPVLKYHNTAYMASYTTIHSIYFLSKWTQYYSAKEIDVLFYEKKVHLETSW